MYLVGPCHLGARGIHRPLPALSATSGVRAHAVGPGARRRQWRMRDSWPRASDGDLGVTRVRRGLDHRPTMGVPRSFCVEAGVRRLPPLADVHLAQPRRVVAGRQRHRSSRRRRAPRTGTNERWSRRAPEDGADVSSSVRQPPSVVSARAQANGFASRVRTELRMDRLAFPELHGLLFVQEEACATRPAPVGLPRSTP